LIALPVFKEVANRLYATKMHDINNVAERPKHMDGLVMKSLRADKFNVIAERLAVAKRLPNAPIWLQNIQADSLGNLTYNAIQINAKQVPDVSGMGLRDALYQLERAGLMVIPKGKGKVVTQSLAPGTQFSKGQTITIQLS
jgi:cell division protein FtsI (penicillin-binding protein 3)